MEPCVDRIVDPDKCGSTLNQSLQLLLYLPSVIHPPPPPPLSVQGQEHARDSDGEAGARRDLQGGEWGAHSCV